MSELPSEQERSIQQLATGGEAARARLDALLVKDLTASLGQLGGELVQTRKQLADSSAAASRHQRALVVWTAVLSFATMAYAVAAFLPLFWRSFAPSASAESAWVLWSRIQDVNYRDRWEDWTSGGTAYPTYSKCWAKIRQYTGVAEEGSLADWYDWTRGLGRYNKRRDIIATESGALVSEPFATEWRCLPDTVNPRGAKGGAR